MDDFYDNLKPILDTMEVEESSSTSKLTLTQKLSVFMYSTDILFRSIGLLPPILPTIFNGIPEPAVEPKVCNVIIDSNQYMGPLPNEILENFHSLDNRSQRIIRKFDDGMGSEIINAIRGGELINSWRAFELFLAIMILKYNFTVEEVEAFAQRVWGNYSPSSSSLFTGSAKIGKFAGRYHRRTNSALQMKNSIIIDIQVNDEIYQWARQNQDHELARHGHQFGIDNPITNPDHLPKNTEYSTIRTKTNNQTRQQFTDAIKTHCEKFPAQDGVTLRGISNGRAHVDLSTGKMVGLLRSKNGKWRIGFAFQLSETQLAKYITSKQIL